MKDKERLWVHPMFKRKLKAEAAMKGMTIFEFTKNVAQISEKEKDFPSAMTKIKPKKVKHENFWGF